MLHLKASLIVGEKILTVHQGRTISIHSNVMHKKFVSKISQQLLQLGIRNMVETLDTLVVLCKIESASSCLLFLLFAHFFSQIQFFTTHFSVSMRARVLKLCLHIQRVEDYCLLSFFHFAFFASLTILELLSGCCTC